MGYSIDGKERYQQPTSGLHDRFRPLIDYNQPKDIKYFVETCWPQYNSISEDRKLPAVIDTLLIPDIKNLPLEVRLATLFIAVENLKTTYAEKVAGYTFKRSHFYDGGNSKGFKALVTEMLAHEGMGSADKIKELTDLRNIVIHTGLTTMTPSDMFRKYAEYKDLISEYIFKIMNYDGSFALYSARGTQFKDLS